MITAINSAGNSGISSQAANNSQTSALTSDFETFLRMLTAQARNQDPLEPLDSSEYASQLAQFSMVEQQVQTNNLLSGLAATQGSVDLSQLASWLGMDVKAAAAFQFDAEPVTLSASAELAADRAVLVVRNDDGEIVDQVAVPVDGDEFQWAGVDTLGNPMPAGPYTAVLQSYRGEELLSESPAATYSSVIEARIEGGRIILTLDSRAEISADQVSGVRAGA